MFEMYFSGPSCVGSSASDPVIVDSGTPSLQLFPTAYDALLDAAPSCKTDADCAVTLKIDGVCVNAAGLMTRLVLEVAPCR